ncbi:hypothetical protein GCM10025867_45320 (plasmid) [Frondihabitans sucicola]|uniref:Uncharacterized protein n=1 Tax=Frondihabitans sucicola TaxID=1268041 RepID=A0ABN6Y8K3_9MICO|nr:hypothetical protein GCM10025867_45320 [Frondihabitans sucicola]
MIAYGAMSVRVTRLSVRRCTSDPSGVALTASMAARSSVLPTSEGVADWPYAYVPFSRTQAHVPRAILPEASEHTAIIGAPSQRSRREPPWRCRDYP